MESLAIWRNVLPEWFKRGVLQLEIRSGDVIDDKPHFADTEII